MQEHRMPRPDPQSVRRQYQRCASASGVPRYDSSRQLGDAHYRSLPKTMTRLDNFLESAESHRLAVCTVSGLIIVIIAWADAQLPTISIGFLYLIPIMLSAAALNSIQIVGLAAICSYLREAFDPLEWSAGAWGRMLTAL